MAAQTTCGSATVSDSSAATHAKSSESSPSTSTITSSVFSASARPWSPSTPWQSQPVTTPEALSSALEECLIDNCCYETPSGLTRRKEVLSSLNLLVRQWIQSISLARGLAWQDLPKMGGRIVTYGSYKLGILHQGADIDALCLAPQHISRQEYFSSFFALLSYQKEVTELRAIEEAFVPVIKMRYDGIEVDMTFARLNIPELPNDDSDNFLARVTISSLESRCLRSLNGYRATEELLRLVPDIERFRLTLRAVKLWAKSKGLYSNTLGFLGGFSWAVLVAKACVTYTEVATAAEMLLKFFELFSTWKWPTPVVLTSLDSGAAAQQSGVYTAHLQSWNPDKNLSERHQVMPVITPTFPHLNSTFNVSLSTQKLVQVKMARAVKQCQNILDGKENWNDLFQASHIFHEYDSFLIVIASAVNHVQWFGLIESKLRYFVNSVEKDFCNVIQSARIWPKPFVQKGETKTSVTKQLWFVGLEFYSHILDPTVDTLRSLQSFRDNLTSHARGFYSPDMLVDAHCVRKSELTTRLSERDIEEIVANQSRVAAPSSRTATNSVRDCPADNSTDPRSSSPSAMPLAASSVPAEQLGLSSEAGSSRGGLSSPSYADAVSKSNSVARTHNRGGNGRKAANVPHLNIAQSHATSTPCSSSMLLMAKYPPPSSPMHHHNHPGAPLTPPPQSHNMRYGMGHVMPSHYSASPCLAMSNSSSSLQDYYGSPNGRMAGRAQSAAGFYANGHFNPNHHYHFYPHRTNMSVYPQEVVMQRTWNSSRNVNHKKGHQYAPTINSHAYSQPPPTMSKTQPASSADCCSTSSTSSSLGGCDGLEGQSYDAATEACAESGALNTSFGSAESDQGCARSVSFSSDKFPPPELTEARLRHAVDKVPFSPLTSPPPSTPPVFSAPYDTSVPPPNVVASSATRTAPVASSQRLSSSELRDMQTPLPVQRYPHQPIHFRFSTSAINHHLQSRGVAADAALDAVITH